jgi:hypothetical protein
MPRWQIRHHGIPNTSMPALGWTLLTLATAGVQIDVQRWSPSKPAPAEVAIPSSISAWE